MATVLAFAGEGEVEFFAEPVDDLGGKSLFQGGIIRDDGILNMIRAFDN